MVAETAKTLRWSAAAGRRPDRAVRGVRDGRPPDRMAPSSRAETARQRPGAGLIIAAPASNPFDDAELHRIAHLVRTHGAGIEVEVACVGDNDDLARAVDAVAAARNRRGGRRTGGLRRGPRLPGCPPIHASFFGPLMCEQALLDGRPASGWPRRAHELEPRARRDRRRAGRRSRPRLRPLARVRGRRIRASPTSPWARARDAGQRQSV